jgi:hypothetical protein
MASTRKLEDTLPLTAPLTRNGDFEARKIAIYATLPLKPSQLRQLEQDLRNADDVSDEDVAQLAPQPQFNNALDIYNHHVNLSKQDTSQHYDPSYFVVADQENWKQKGILFVNLTADTEQRESLVLIWTGLTTRKWSRRSLVRRILIRIRGTVVWMQLREVAG